MRKSKIRAYLREEPKVSKRHTEEEMAETEPFVPTDSKFAELLDYDNLANMPDDEDVLDEEEYDEDEALIEAGFTDELPDEEPDPDEEERLKKWMEETVKEYENIGKFMNGASGGKKINDEDYLDFF